MSKKNKNISKIQILRIIVQILSLIIIPGIFVVTLSEIKEIYISIIHGKFDITTILNMIELIAIIPITVIIGRFFCGWICAFGTFNDFVYMISKKVFKLKYKIPESIDSKLKYAKYGGLLFLIVFVWTMGSKTLDGSSPWDAFAQLPNILAATKGYTIGFILLILITIGAVFIERFFCRYLCPLGAIFSLLSKVRILNISKTKDKCGKCRICTNNCAMGIPMYKFDKIVSGECINCFKCVDVCPRQNTKITILGKEVTAKVASSISLVLFTILYGSANALEHVIEVKSMYVSQQGSLVSSSKSSKYKDGVYRGIGKGYKEGLEL
ncbi:MAG: 4Fe-4S binding protein, partial [Romboutsia sp.]